MKIYNKHNFVEGLFMLLLAILGFSLDIIKHEFEIRGIVISGMLLLFGISSLVRSFSQCASREDKIEERDERNQLIKLKSKSKALNISQSVYFWLTMGCIFALAKTKSTEFTGLIVGFGLAWSISMLAEIIANFYYESKN